MNEAKTTAGSKALVLDTAGQTLGKEVTLVERNANSFVISDDVSYARAVQFAQSIKAMQKKVTDYWEPLRASTYQAYQDVLNKKKQMTNPLDKAEKALKVKIGTYAARKERERREQEEAARKAAQAEMDRKLAEAAALEKKGDAIGAEMAMAEAEIMDDAATSIVVADKAPKVKGVATSKTWRIKSIDLSKVPVEIAGVIIRPVDEKAVMGLIKATKGQVKIPGIEYEETVSVSIRA